MKVAPSLIFMVALFFSQASMAQHDTLPFPNLVMVQDTPLRIININPYFTLHVDSTLIYQLEINKNPIKYYWYLRNSPVGLKINKDNGLLTFKAEKSFFYSGKLKYDQEYKVNIGVQNLNDPKEKVDTFFTIVFYNTDIIPSKVKPSKKGILSDSRFNAKTGVSPLKTLPFLRTCL
jgi:hypothetical protein